MKCLGSPVLGDALYAAAADAALEDRAYLHSAALRIPAGYCHLSDDGAPIEVVCAPNEGEHFRSADFQRAFRRWFVGEEDRVDDKPVHRDVWFAGTPIKSVLDAG
mmetsp:Transcript_9534/g.24753  ORF Transcript_9534/g.24753 Transcript_9534/m.24753 type:complete len:105 (-) Transcript_9534:183-497(-)